MNGSGALGVRLAVAASLVIGAALCPTPATAGPSRGVEASTGRPEATANVSAPQPATTAGPQPVSPTTSPQPGPPTDALPDTTDDDGGASGRRPYPGDPQLESGLVADEDRRLVQARSIDALGRWGDLNLQTPYRLASGAAYTLILTQRRHPYTVRDLLALAPQTFVRMPDGAYLLSEHLIIREGATLDLSAGGALTLRLASDGQGFVSIINDGGRLAVAGTRGEPVRVTSWDRETNSPDNLTADGRAYIRSLGGQVTLRHVEVTQLGFWSGRTGGLSLTGTDRPNTGALDALGQALESLDEQAAAAKAQKSAGQGPVTGGASGLTLNKILPSGALPLPEVDLTDPRYSYVSAKLDGVRADGNAYGLFVASANGVEIRGSSFSNSLVDGLVLHRFVTNAVIEQTSALDNGGDGIILSRATTGIVLNEVTSSRNVRNGVLISGRPLANGPNATGTPTGAYGNNSLSNSTLVDNGHYAVDVVGGSSIGVQANDIRGGHMGVVVRQQAHQVSVVGNRVDATNSHAIDLREGATEAVVSGNMVSGGSAGIYLSGAAASVRRNTLTGALQHGISVVGDVRGSQIEGNTVAGRGSSAIDSSRAMGLELRRGDNDVSGWEDTTPWLVTLKRFLQPLTLLWLALGALVVITALLGLRRRAGIQHPYADKAPVSGPEDLLLVGAQGGHQEAR